MLVKYRETGYFVKKSTEKNEKKPLKNQEKYQSLQSKYSVFEYSALFGPHSYHTIRI